MTRTIYRDAETDTLDGLIWLKTLSETMSATFPTAETINLYYQERYKEATCGVIGYARWPFSFQVRTDLALDAIPAVLEQWRDDLIERQERMALEQGLA